MKFLLATTDPQKLPVTVLSRCLQFNLKRLSVALISARLQYILEAEQIALRAAQPCSCWRRPATAACAMRSRCSISCWPTARAAALRGRGARHARHRAARSGACASRSCWPRRDARALLAATRSALDELRPDYAQLLDQLAALLERVALRQLVPGYDGDELHPAEMLAPLAEQLGPEDVQLYYQTAILGRRDLALAPDPRTGFRMTLMRMLAFRPAAPWPPAARAAGAPPARAPQRLPSRCAAPFRRSAAPAAAPGGITPMRPPGRSWLAALDLQGARAPAGQPLRAAAARGRDRAPGTGSAQRPRAHARARGEARRRRCRATVGEPGAAGDRGARAAAPRPRRRRRSAPVSSSASHGARGLRGRSDRAGTARAI